jgi:hypothetical protein
VAAVPIASQTRIKKKLKPGLQCVYMSQTEIGLVNATFRSNLIKMCKIVLVMKHVWKRAEPAEYALILCAYLKKKSSNKNAS